MLLPVVTCLIKSSLIAPASTTSCMLLKREPSFNSMKVTPLESRRDRTQPRNAISLPTGDLNACLTEENGAVIWSQYRLTTYNVNGSLRYACRSSTSIYELQPLADDVRFEKVFLWPRALRLSLKTSRNSLLKRSTLSRKWERCCCCARIPSNSGMWLPSRNDFISMTSRPVKFWRACARHCFKRTAGA